MKLIEIFEESISVLNTNKLRTGLSALGIIIGVGSVIALMTLGQASQQSVKSRIQSLGSNLLTIRAGAAQQGFLGGQGSRTTLTLDDAIAMSKDERITTISKVAAEYSSRSQISYGRSNLNVSVSGVTADFFTLRNITVSSGSLIDDQAILSNAKVVVLTPTVAQTLFGDSKQGVGQDINIDGSAYRVLGITASSSSGFGGNNQTIYIPISTAQKILYGVNHVSTIYVAAKNPN
jgi:putative ABC transport system permease protein